MGNWKISSTASSFYSHKKMLEAKGLAIASLKLRARHQENQVNVLLFELDARGLARVPLIPSFSSLTTEPESTLLSPLFQD